MRQMQEYLRSICGDSCAAVCVLGAVGIVIAIFFAWQSCKAPIDPREPPVVEHDLPIVGHLLGIIRFRHGYHQQLYDKHHLPACTLPILTGKTYRVFDTRLVCSILSNTRTLSVGPTIKQVLVRLTRVSNTAAAIYTTPEFETRWIRMLYECLSGPNLLLLSQNVLLGILDGDEGLNNLPRSAVEAAEIPDLYMWFQDLFTPVIADAFLGRERSPWRNDRSGLVRDLCLFQENVGHLFFGLAWLTAPRALIARNRIHRLLCTYFTSEDSTRNQERKYDDRADLTKRAFDGVLRDQYGWAVSDRASFMLGVLHGATANTVPTTFWLFVHIFTDRTLVRKLRKELLRVVTLSESGVEPDLGGESTGEGEKQAEMNSNSLEDEAGSVGPKAIATVHLQHLNEMTTPILVACWRENLRVISESTMTRHILADTVMSYRDGDEKQQQHSFLFKQGYTLQSSSKVGHQSAEIWGADVGEFKPGRFLIPVTNSSSDEEDEDAPVQMIKGETPVERGAYTPFGGGKHLCPGRKFAMNETLGLMAALLLGFDVTGPDGETMKVPKRSPPSLAEGIGRPMDGEMRRAKIFRREGWENVVWKVDIGNSSDGDILSN